MSTVIMLPMFGKTSTLRLVALVLACAVSWSGVWARHVSHDTQKEGSHEQLALQAESSAAGRSCSAHKHCYFNYLDVSNYCCMAEKRCCTVVGFFFQLDKPLDETFRESAEDPRPINIIALVVVLLAMIGYCFCGCCLSQRRKYAGQQAVPPSAPYIY